jgi:4-aminobutyrate aminotransferase-like enzyme
MKLVNGLRDHRVLISASSLLGNVLKIRPPLPFSEENARQFLSILDQVFEEIEAKEGLTQ